MKILQIIYQLIYKINYKLSSTFYYIIIFRNISIIKYKITYIPKGIPNNFVYGLSNTFSQFIGVFLIVQNNGIELFIKTIYPK